MDLRRDIYKKLIKWKEDTGKVLELNGARQAETKENNPYCIEKV